MKLIITVFIHCVFLWRFTVSDADASETRKVFIERSNELLKYNTQHPKCKTSYYDCAITHEAFSRELFKECLNPLHSGILTEILLAHIQLALGLMKLAVQIQRRTDITLDWWVHHHCQAAQLLSNRANSIEALGHLETAFHLVLAQCASSFPELVAGPLSSRFAANNKFSAASIKHANVITQSACYTQFSIVTTLLGSVYNGLNKWEEAHDAYRETVTYSPGTSGAWIELARSTIKTRGGRLREDDVITILEQLQLSSTKDNDRSTFHHCLWEYYQKRNQYQQAWEHLTRANMWKKMAVSDELLKVHDSSHEVLIYQDMFSGQISPNLRQAMGYRPPPSKPQITPVFIVGMFRSGTTLLETILSAHPNAYGFGEETMLMPLISDGLKTLGSGPTATHDMMRNLGQSYIEKTLARGPKSVEITHTIDKQPHNFWNAGFILSSMPNAKIIWARRNPLDSGLSLLAFPFPTLVGYSFTPAEAGLQLNNMHRMMQHWYKIFGKDNFFELHYEEMLLDQERTTRRLCQFLELDFNDNMIRYHKRQTTMREVQTGSKIDVNQPLFSRSVGRARPYIDQMMPLIENLGPDMVDTAFQWWEEHGVFENDTEQEKAEWRTIQGKVRAIKQRILEDSTQRKQLPKEKRVKQMTDHSRRIEHLHKEWQMKFQTIFDQAKRGEYLPSFPVQQDNDDSELIVEFALPNQDAMSRTTPILHTKATTAARTSTIQRHGQAYQSSSDDDLSKQDTFWSDDEWDW